MFSWPLVRRAVFACLTLMLLAGCQPEAVDSSGQPVNFSEYRGKWVVINYWATWCAPCIAEIPDLVKLTKYYPDNVVVLGVNIDQLDNAVLQKLRYSYRINYRLLAKFPIEKYGAKQPKNLPITFIFSPNGKLHATLTGRQTLSNFQTIMNLPPITYN